MNHLVSLFHGTTLEAAVQIRNEGWRARDLTGRIGELARRHDVSVADVVHDLRRYNRFMVIEKDRGEVASFTPDYEAAAGRWAQRAPEVEWDALWAIWRIKYSGEQDMYHWNLDVAGHAWVLEQMAHRNLAVVEIALTIEGMLELGARVGGFAHGPLTPELVPLLPGLPEVSLPLPFQPSTEPIIHLLERRVGWDIFAHWLGLTNEQFAAMDEAGRFGSAGEGDFEVRPWWPLAAVDAVLDSVDAGTPVDQL
jgi:hypothetical protein